MKKIKTIKEIVTSPAYRDSDKNVHFIGEIITKKDASFGNGKSREERTKLLIKSSNFCVEGEIAKREVGDKYEYLVKAAKINGGFYFEGNINVDYGDVRIMITDIDSNVLLKQLEHEEETAEIKLLKYITSGKEDEAVTLLNENKSININYEFINYTPIFLIVNSYMCDLFEEVINYPNFDLSIKDDFSETLLESLIYIYGSNMMKKPNRKGEKAAIGKMIKSFLKTNGEHFNLKDINSDTAINISCEIPSALWITEALLEKEEVNINIVNDVDCAALGNAIRTHNIEAIKLLSKRKDLIVREEDVQLAKKYDVNLEELGIDISHTTAYVLDKTAERYKELAEACKA